MKKFRIYAWERDSAYFNYWRFIGVLKAESEHDAFTQARKKFKFVRNKTLDAREYTKD